MMTIFLQFYFVVVIFIIIKYLKTIYQSSNNPLKITICDHFLIYKMLHETFKPLFLPKRIFASTKRTHSCISRHRRRRKLRLRVKKESTNNAKIEITLTNYKLKYNKKKINITYKKCFPWFQLTTQSVNQYKTILNNEIKKKCQTNRVNVQNLKLDSFRLWGKRRSGTALDKVKNDLEFKLHQHFE